MAPAYSIEGRSLLKLLDDGQWHALEGIMQALAATVAPGRALRRYEEREDSRRRISGAPRSTRELTDDEKIASGRRTIANVTVNSYKKRYVELAEDDDGHRIIRKRPDAPDRSLPKVDTMTIPAPPDTPNADQPPPQAAPQGEPPVSLSSCDICGGVIFDMAVHTDYHANSDVDSPNPSVAFFSEHQVRTIVADEIGVALDQFQRGMQHWLSGRFSDLENGRPRPSPPRKPVIDPRPVRSRRRHV